MIITGLSMCNWLPYRGQHHLKLDRTVYGVVATREGDAARSNWQGKTAFGETIPFALFGVHRKATEDEWITTGEQEGWVALEFDDGAFLERRRARGNATRVKFRDPSGKVLNGKDAEEAIESYVGLSQVDFLMTCFYKQRTLAQMVLAQPAERTAIVTKWLKLEPLKEAEQRAVNAAATATAGTAEHRAAMQRIEQALGIAPGAPFVQEIDTAIAGFRRDIKGLKIAQGNLRDRADAFKRDIEALGVKEWNHHYSRVEQAERIRARMKVERAKAGSKAELAVAVEKRDAHQKEFWVAEQEHARAMLDRSNAQQLCQGKFDGVCPVTLRSCPIAGQISSDNEAAQRKFSAASQRARELEERKRSLRTTLEYKVQEVEALLHAAQCADSFEAQLELLKDSIDYVASHAPPDSSKLVKLEAELGSLWDQNANLAAEIKQLEGMVQTREQLKAEWLKCGEALRVQERLAERYRLAGLIFAQTRKQVSQVVTRQMVERGNATLQQSGIALDYDLQWSSEGNGLARTCERCGAPYPPSAKVKQCSRCGATRGPHMIEKLTVAMSDRSGAAEDLVGAAIRLSASAWLRAERNSQWGTVWIDEPFGQLDEHNREALAQHLATMLRGQYGFGQAFIVAHHRDITAAMAGSILITGSEQGTRIKVI